MGFHSFLTPCHHDFLQIENRNNSSDAMTIHRIILLATCVVSLFPVAKVDTKETCRQHETCTVVNECKTLLKRHGGAYDDNVLFACGFHKLTLKVCCPIHPNLQLLPHETCGMATGGDRITSGKNADIGQFPWMALLAFKDQNTRKVSYLCGGTLINDRYVLTAAHCLNATNATLVGIRLGEYNISSEIDCVSGWCSEPVRDYPIEEIIPHKSYNTPFLKNDIALIRLQGNVSNYTDHIRPICLPFELKMAEKAKYIIAGWGKVHYGAKGGSEVLQFTSVPEVDHDACEFLQSEDVKPLAESQICAGGDRGKDACKGDSGGPLMHYVTMPDKIEPRIYQIGIVSFGSIPCGEENIPSVYTRVSSYLKWILDNIQE